MWQSRCSQLDSDSEIDTARFLRSFFRCTSIVIRHAVVNSTLDLQSCVARGWNRNALAETNLQRKRCVPHATVAGTELCPTPEAQSSSSSSSSCDRRCRPIPFLRDQPWFLCVCAHKLLASVNRHEQ
jgi:hypothetical protein